MNITIIGTGYVGLVTGTCLSEMGNTVYCVDIDEQKVEQMRKGTVPIYEPHLEELFSRNLDGGRLNFTTDMEDAVKKSTIIFLALPTPKMEDDSADLSSISQVANELSQLIDDYKIIINKSTVPVGTSEMVKEVISRDTYVDFDVVSNPEFLREGYAVKDFMEPQRIIVGTKSERARKILKNLYKPFIDVKRPIIFMDERSSELTKYAANTFLATKISFMNEMANLCEKMGADVDLVRMGMGSDNRIGNRFLFPGIGYGGSCFPKDVNALVKSSDENSYDFKILKSVLTVNEAQKRIIIPKIRKFFNGKLKKRKIALWGLSFKPNTDDIREAPSLDIINELLMEEAQVSAYDPEAMNNVEKIYGDKLVYEDSAYSILRGADALIICTEWSEFVSPDFDRIKSLMNKAVIFDGRNIFDLNIMKQHGFHYESIGREVVMV